MIDLKQKELFAWMNRNFDEKNMEKKLFQCVLGMSEEVGEVSHLLLKSSQKIREGENGLDLDLFADGIADTLIFGLQALSILGIDAEKEISKTIEQVLQRDWKSSPSTGEPKQESKKKEVQTIEINHPKLTEIILGMVKDMKNANNTFESRSLLGQDESGMQIHLVCTNDEKELIDDDFLENAIKSGIMVL